MSRRKLTTTGLAALALASAPAGAIAVAAGPGGQGTGRARIAAAPVSVFPSPGAGYVTPATTIAFRGLPVASLGTISVSGSRSGVHTGTLRSDSDGAGGSFIPARPFTQGETVTVHTTLDVLDGRAGTFRFHIATLGRPIRAIPAVQVPRVTGDVLRFRTRPDLVPAALKINRNSRGAAAGGDIFLASQNGPVTNGPAIYDGTGHLVLYRPMPKGVQSSDFRTQMLRGKPVLTWWQGTLGPGVGAGVDEIYSSDNRHLATVHAGNGLSADLHEFSITPKGTALILAYLPVITDARAVKGGRRAPVLDCVVQEIDIPTGLVLYQWDALDHIPLTESELPPPKAPFAYDPVHLNSVEADSDGSLLLSARNTWTLYKVSRTTGTVIWRLGGKRSTFKLSPGGVFAFQHDARVRAANDRLITLFDDGAGPPLVHKQSRGITLRLDAVRHTARVVSELKRPPFLANFEGNLQRLPNGDSLIGWGQQPYFTEYNGRGKVVAEGHTVGSNTIYRVYRFPWSGTPATTRPSVATHSAAGRMTVYMSWNGATTVASWRVLAGASKTALRPARTVKRSDFETTTEIRPAAYIQVEALDAGGKVLGRSAVRKAS